MSKEVKNINKTISYRKATAKDGFCLYRLVERCKPLDLNSVYHYILLADHFGATCVMAEAAGEAVGYISAYIHPQRPDTVFVWQVAVDSRMRGQGLGRKMLMELLVRDELRDVSFLETTITPSNTASRRLFAGLAKGLDAHLEESEYFTAELFGGTAHESENLFRIGPFEVDRG